jgi:hypothetical protein
VSYRWCGERAVLERPVEDNSQAFEVAIQAGPVPQTVSLTSGGQAPMTITLNPGEKRVVTLSTVPGSQGGETSMVRFEASASFVPRLLWPQSGDTRRLAFKVY